MIPWVRLLWRRNRLTRVLASFLNYTAIMVQITFTKADFAWVANCPDILTLPLALARRPYVLEYRSPWALEVQGEFGSGPWVRVASVLERLSLRYAHAVTITTSQLRGRVSRYHKPTFLIPNYPLSSFGEAVVPTDELRATLGCGADSKVVLFVGKLSSSEGADLLPGLFDAVLGKESDAVFWILGDGPLYMELVRIASRHGGKVKMIGWKPFSQVANYIAASDVCIAPRHASPFSTYYNEEGVIKLSEYMYFQKPIVACGVSESEQYWLVEEDQMAASVLESLSGRGRLPKRMTWEEQSVPALRELISFLRSR
jgi:glycosyltransferase involved in cell wall biosynthesis